MDYDRYTDRPVTLTVGLINLACAMEEVDRGALRSFVVSTDLHDDEPLTDADLDGLALLARRLRPVFAGDLDAAATALNDVLAEARPAPHLARHDGQGWHLHHVEDGAPVARWFSAASAMALAVLVGRDGVERFGTCAADGCDQVFVDTSRNRSKRFCSASCMNRTKQAAYRARQADEEE